MPKDIDEQLRGLMPELSTAPPSNDIPPVDVPVDFTPDFGAPKKRRSRRPKLADPPPIQDGPAPEVQTAPTTLTPVEREQIAKALGVGFHVIFAIIASKRGSHWQISPADEQLLGATWTDALAPWLVSSSKYVPVAIATLATIGVIVPRMDVDSRLHPKPQPIDSPVVPPAQPEVKLHD